MKFIELTNYWSREKVVVCIDKIVYIERKRDERVKTTKTTKHAVEFGKPTVYQYTHISFNSFTLDVFEQLEKVMEMINEN